jgi:CheY-like chemotaxis protein
LVGNAIKFTDQGAVRLEARLAESAGKTLLFVDVIDSGIGIPEQALTRIFDPFSQADTSVTRKFGGTGLGLAISRQLAEAMGGNITVSSKVGVGSTFSVSFDPGTLTNIRLLSREELSRNMPQHEHKTANQHPLVRLTGTCILVVDDGETNRDLVSLVLRRAGAVVETAENGKEAVEAIRRKNGKYDVVLMDMQMPLLDGYSATRLLRKLGYQLPIVALTAHALQDDEAKCLAAGCTSFLTKPLNMDRLFETLAQLLRRELVVDSTTDSTRSHPTSSRSRPTKASTSAPSPNRKSFDETKSPAVPANRTSKHPQPAPDAKSRSVPRDEPLLCQLPLDDAEFRDIAESFLQKLDEQLDLVERLLISAKFAEIAQVAHWLKGSGGTAGFPDFTEPSRALETAARAADQQQLLLSLRKLRSLQSRVLLPAEV